MRLFISPTLSNRILISDGDMPIFCAEASIANTVKARRSNSGEPFSNCSLSSIYHNNVGFNNSETSTYRLMQIYIYSLKFPNRRAENPRTIQNSKLKIPNCRRHCGRQRQRKPRAEHQACLNVMPRCSLSYTNIVHTVKKCYKRKSHSGSGTMRRKWRLAYVWSQYIWSWDAIYMELGANIYGVGVQYAWSCTPKHTEYSPQKCLFGAI